MIAKLFVFIFILIFFSLGIYADSGIILNLEIPEKYSKITPGSELLVNTEIILIKDNYNLVDIIIDYVIYDENGNVVNRLTETKGTITRLNAIKEIKIPKDFSPGFYTLEIKANYKGIERKTQQNFEIIQPYSLDLSNFSNSQSYIIIIIIIIMLVVNFYYQNRKFRRIEKLIKNKNENKLLFK